METTENPSKHDKPDKRVNAFILTRQWLESSAGFQLVFWMSTKQGPLRYEVGNQEAVFFVPSARLERVKALLKNRQGWRSQSVSLKDFANNKVSAVYFRSQRSIYDVRRLLQDHGIPVFEADVKPPDRFLMERFITAAVSLRLPFQQSGKVLEAYGSSENTLQAAEYRPSLKSVSVDIETDYAGVQLFSIALYSKNLKRIFMVSEQHSEPHQERLDDEAILIYLEDEKQLLERFLICIDDLDPDVIMGWNIVNFDLRCLQNACDRYDVLFTLGRQSQTINWRQSRESENRFYALVPGRVVLDGIELMRSATYQFESFSLDNVAKEILQRGKLVDNVDERSTAISWQFDNDKPALARYNLEDCRLVWDIFAKEKLIEFAIERSLLTGLEVDRYGGSVAAFDYLYLPRLHRQGYVAPTLDQQRTSNISPGGYVMNSLPGIFDNVIVLDFKSLYPSIIRTFNIDPLALIQGLDATDVIEGYDGGRFTRDKAILPELIERLWSARDKAKADKNTVLSQAIKIIMNSFYGVLGTRGCRFLDSRLVSSITRRGHEIIIESKRFIESRGYQVIYGDTDSVFVLTKSSDSKSATKVGVDLAKEMNNWWAQKLRKEHAVQSCLEVEFETLFVKFLMPTVRGSETGSKKRYAGMIEKENQSAKATGKPDYALIFKGLESVRSDWSPLARQFQQELYRRIFVDEPFVDYIKSTIADLRAGKYKEELVLRKRLRRKLEDYVKNVPPHVQAARKAETMRKLQKGLNQESGEELSQNTKAIEYYITHNGPEPKQYLQSEIDYDFYIEKQITPIADSILAFKSTSVEIILNRQIGLF